MLNLLEDWRWRSLPEGALHTSPGLAAKVDGEGQLRPYRGNTVVFTLPEGTRDTLHTLREELYTAAPELLAQRLGTESFHMTLHDLVSGAPEDPDLEGRMAGAEAAARGILRELNGQPPLFMRGTWTFNMVNTSVVLGLEPADGESYRRLEEGYNALQGVVPLDYPLCPHITLAYFRPGVHGGAPLDALRRVLRPAPLAVELSFQRLRLQRFEDMGRYFDL